MLMLYFISLCLFYHKSHSFLFFSLYVTIYYYLLPLPSLHSRPFLFTSTLYIYLFIILIQLPSLPLKHNFTSFLHLPPSSSFPFFFPLSSWLRIRHPSISILSSTLRQTCTLNTFFAPLPPPHQASFSEWVRKPPHHPYISPLKLLPLSHGYQGLTETRSCNMKLVSSRIVTNEAAPLCSTLFYYRVTLWINVWRGYKY